MAVGDGEASGNVGDTVRVGVIVGASDGVRVGENVTVFCGVNVAVAPGVTSGRAYRFTVPSVNDTYSYKPSCVSPAGLQPLANVGSRIDDGPNPLTRSTRQLMFSAM